MNRSLRSLLQGLALSAASYLGWKIGALAKQRSRDLASLETDIAFLGQMAGDPDFAKRLTQQMRWLG